MNPDLIYNSYSTYLKNKYGKRVFRVGLSTGLPCPNRINHQGCSFCLSETFTDASIQKKLSLKAQLDSIIPKIRQDCGDVDLIAYFQDNTSTYGDLNYLKTIFQEALSYTDFKEIIISTRPDYLNQEVVEMLLTLQLPITIEVGIQSMNQSSLDFLTRNHTIGDNQEAIALLSNYPVDIGVHLILGIPGETTASIQNTLDFINHEEKIKFVKLHNLIIFEGTALAEKCKSSDFKTYDMEEYFALLGYALTNLHKDKIITRLFTSNLSRNGKALNPFPRDKRFWMNEFYRYCLKNNIKQI